MFAIGYDIGSSSVKAALVDLDTNQSVGLVKSPDHELAIDAPQIGWAEQDPATWWEHVKITTQKLLAETGVAKEDIKSIGLEK